MFSMTGSLDFTLLESIFMVEDFLEAVPMH